MTRQKKEEQYFQICQLIYLSVLKQGYFNWWWEEGDELFTNVARTLQCPVHRVKRVFYKDLLVNNEEWFEGFTY